MTTSLKIKDWKEGNYCSHGSLNDSPLLRELEMMVLEELKKPNKLPPGAFVVSVRLEVDVDVQGTAEEIKVYTWKAEPKVKEVVMEATDLKLEESKSTEWPEGWQKPQAEK